MKHPNTYLLCWCGTAYLGWSSWYHLSDGSIHRPLCSTLLGVDVSKSTRADAGPGGEMSEDDVAWLPLLEIRESWERLGSVTPLPLNRDWLRSIGPPSGGGLEILCKSIFSCCCCCWWWAAAAACMRWTMCRWPLWSEFSLLRDSVSSWLRLRPDNRRYD